MRAADDLAWPDITLAEWRDTRETVHLWTQIVGKVRLALAPSQNHWWHVPFYVNTRGLTTSPIPFGDRSVGLMFDFVQHNLVLFCSDGSAGFVPLRPMSVAAFHSEFMRALSGLGVHARIWPVPVERSDPVPFAQDEEHAAYDGEYVQRFWRALVSSDRVMNAFRGRWLGKSSPVHFFWGSFDLAVTRFSGAVAPPHPGAPGVPDRVTREAYSHEVSSAGFWPGGDGLEEAVFYAYAYPNPPTYEAATVVPAEARWNAALGEFVLPYAAVRTAAQPERELDAFLESTYVAAAERLGWDRATLERRI